MLLSVAGSPRLTHPPSQGTGWWVCVNLLCRRESSPRKISTGALAEPVERALDQASRRVGQDCRKASRSALIVSAWVVGIPCGNPLYVFSVPFCTSWADSGPESA